MMSMFRGSTTILYYYVAMETLREITALKEWAFDSIVFITERNAIL